MKINRLQAWLDEQGSYADGVNLYIQYGANEPLKRMLAKRESAFNREKLTEAITDIIKSGQFKIINFDSPVAKPVAKSKTIAKKVPKDVDAVITLRNDCYKKAGHLHGHDLRSQDRLVRKKAAFEIKRLMNINRECWDKLHYFQRFGFVPAENNNLVDDLSDLSIEDLIKRRNNNRAYISKSTPKIKSIPSKANRYKKEIARRTQENDRIQSILDNVPV